MRCWPSGRWSAVRRLARCQSPAWSEVRWPFPLDQWGKGKAFRCKAADCGTEVTVYIRAKIGFCNCTTGVSDDEELDRISGLRPARGNQACCAGARDRARSRLAWMAGRSRAFKVGGAPVGGQRRPSRSASTTTATRSLRPWCMARTNRRRSRACGAGVPQQQDRDRLGRGHARAVRRDQSSWKEARESSWIRIGRRRSPRFAVADEVAIGEAEPRDRAAKLTWAGSAAH